ncbi:MAG: UDP-N-acetylmuramoyl-L-alanine--D-glutamate ligase [Mangrovibacterium sp.]
MSKRIVILGGGESGVGAAVLAQQNGFDVFLSDKSAIAPKYSKVLEEHGIAFEQNMHTEELLLHASEVIKSPGIPDTAPLIQKLKAKRIPIISEIEFAARYTNATKICITGSNGKTTTTMLAYQLLKDAGLNVGLAGNVGQSFALQVAQCNYDYYVLELSSFQLDGMYDFKAEVAILLNITPDHLDRYNYEFSNYVNSKFRIIQNQTPADYFIYWNQDPVIKAEMEKREIKAKCLPFTDMPFEQDGAAIEGDKLVLKLNQNDFIMSIFEIELQGKHNTYNSMAAGLAGKVLGIKNERIRESLSGFHGVEHRLENFIKVQGVDYINDSKATNVNSTWYALESMDKPTIWIVGGVDKGNDYAELDELVKQKVKAIICLGRDNKKIIEHFGGMVDDILDVSDMKKAVKASSYLAEQGDVVLLSPACASFDLFDDYEDRGRQFKSAVHEL